MSRNRRTFHLAALLACNSLALHAAPEISVAGNWTFIPDGSIDPMPINGTSLGNSPVGDVSNGKYAQIQVFNTGTTTLQLDTTWGTFEGANGTDFNTGVGNEFTKTIAPGGFSQFSIACHPKAAGERTATFHLHSNDSDEGDYNFALSCNGVNEPWPSLPDLVFLQPDEPKLKIKNSNNGTKYQISGKFLIFNRSQTVDTPGPFSAVTTFSADRFVDNSDLVAKPKKLAKLKAYHTKSLKYKFTVDSLPNTSTIIAFADHLGDVPEMIEINNRQGVIVPVP